MMKKLFLLMAFAVWCHTAFALIHTVARGESLESIAHKYSITVEQLVAANPGAQNLFYVGLKLNIPEAVTESTPMPIRQDNTRVQNSSDVKYYEDNNYNVENTNSDSEDTFEQERKDGALEISFCAGTFEEVKLSGSYGLSWTSFPWKLAPRFYAGYHFSPFNFNYGLVDKNSTSDLIKFGPAIGYYFTPKIFVAVPLDVLCDVYFDSNDNTKTEWGMSLAPTLYLGSKGGIFIGPQFTIAFVKSSEISCGFRAGIYF